MVLVSLKDKQIDGARVETICEKINIALNKNSIPGDKSALVPGGVRIGAPAMTTRGLGEEDFKKIVSYIDFAVNYAKEIQANLPKDANKLKDFKNKVLNTEDEKLQAVKKEISQWAGEFPLSV
mmetsp:Transcript_5399/g.6790  ORF Transcript_5399/g.6790 Transcript_5399/m.6790 type:complete len:123 (+) Transcript_5399:149-517(+)